MRQMSCVVVRCCAAETAVKLANGLVCLLPSNEVQVWNKLERNLGARVGKCSWEIDPCLPILWGGVGSSDGAIAVVTRLLVRDAYQVCLFAGGGMNFG